MKMGRLTRRLAGLVLTLGILAAPTGFASAAKPGANVTATITLAPGANLVYGGSATFDITVTNFGNDSATLFTWCNQGGVDFITGVNGVISEPGHVVNPTAAVTFPYNGTTNPEWTGGAATCHADLNVYEWQGNRVVQSFVAATSLPFNVAA